MPVRSAITVGQVSHPAELVPEYSPLVRQSSADLRRRADSDICPTTEDIHRAASDKMLNLAGVAEAVLRDVLAENIAIHAAGGRMHVSVCELTRTFRSSLECAEGIPSLDKTRNRLRYRIESLEKTAGRPPLNVGHHPDSVDRDDLVLDWTDSVLELAFRSSDDVARVLGRVSGVLGTPDPADGDTVIRWACGIRDKVAPAMVDLAWSVRSDLVSGAGPVCGCPSDDPHEDRCPRRDKTHAVLSAGVPGQDTVARVRWPPSTKGHDSGVPWECLLVDGRAYRPKMVGPIPSDAYTAAMTLARTTERGRELFVDCASGPDLEKRLELASVLADYASGPRFPANVAAVLESMDGHSWDPSRTVEQTRA